MKPSGTSKTTKLTIRAAIALVVASAGAALCLATPAADISSPPGPLTHVWIGNDLSCQVEHIADAPDYEFYGPDEIPGDSGTFIAMDGALYAPDFANHDYSSAEDFIGTYTPFTPVSQTGVTGSGATADPFKVITVVDVAATGLVIQQTDTYVAGQEYYTTEVMISNIGAATASGVLYRAADAFLGGSDTGYGFTEVFSGNRNAVGCSNNADNSPPDKIEEFIALTGGNNYFQNEFDMVWSAIGSKMPFPDTCACTDLLDNGAGIGWNFSIPAGGSATYSHVTTFSPLGFEGLVTSKTADSPTSPAGTQNGYTITIQNPNPNDVTVSSITDTLPAGFAYTPGSTTGATTTDPAIVAQMLTWSGSFTVPASGSISFHFAVKVADTPGDYFNEVGGSAEESYDVISTGPTAEITVTAAPTPTPTAAATATFTPTPEPTATATATFTPTPTATFTPTATATATATAIAAATATATFTPTPTATFTPTPTATYTPTPTPTPAPCAGLTISQISGTIVPGDTDTGNHADDLVTNVALPFPYMACGTAHTSINVSVNGNAQFTTSDVDYLSNTCLPWSSHDCTIFPYWDDLRTDDNSGCTGYPGDTCGIYTSVSGTAPNRIFNIEWRAVYMDHPDEKANFELRLYEGQNKFDVIYGILEEGNSGATAGVQCSDICFAQYFCNGSGGSPTGGWTAPGPGCAPGATPTPTATATATATSTPTSTATSTPTATPASTSTPTSTPTPTATPQAGIFVIGDLDAVVGTKITFWGAQWDKANDLSGGSAPASFKGFANVLTPNPPSCGGTWQSDPGNSCNPPDSVSGYITAIAASSIVKSGSIISGNSRKMVIIQTNPGYGPAPGHTGTGTVTAVICSQ